MSNKNYAFIVISVTIFSSISSYCQSLYKVDEDEKVQHSSLIIEGKVISQKSFWNPSHTIIFTTNTVEVYKVFKGVTTTSHIEVVTTGGSVGGESLEVSDLLSLANNDIGVFFCYPNTFALRSPISNNLLLDVWSSSQGFLSYDLAKQTASAPFARYSDIAGELYNSLQQKTGRAFTDVKPSFIVSDYVVNGRTDGTLAISTFFPSIVDAGATLNQATNLLTIQGTGFGSPAGSAAVLFDDANNGTGGTPFIVPYNDPLIVSWTSTQIQVRVPTRAGTGTFEVRDDAGGLSGASSILTVRFSISTSTSLGYTKESNLMSDNGAGGYTIQYSTSTAGSGINLDTDPAKATFQRALTTWKEICGFHVVEGPTTTSQQINPSDNLNVIMYDNANTGNAALAAGTLAVCYSFNSICNTAPAANQIRKTQFDIVLRNPGYSTGSTSLTAGPCPPASSSSSDYDLETVILHELGHALNLGHINDSYQGGSAPNFNPGKLMNYAIVSSTKRSSPDYAAIAGATYVIQPQGNVYGSCAVYTEMTPLATTLESKDNCPTFPVSPIGNNTVVPFDLVHATSDKFVDPQYTAVNCLSTGVGVTNTAYYAFKTHATGGSTMFVIVSDYNTTPLAQAACTPTAPFSAAAGVELALYQVSSCPLGQAFPSPIACRTFNGNGALTTFTGMALNTSYLLMVDGIENTKATFSLTLGGTVLPIRLLDFSGKIINDNNQIKWTVDYSVNVQTLTLERSADGINFTAINVINGNNITRDGLYNDVRPLTRNNFYRLAVKNIDGSKEYSKIVLLSRNDKFLVSVFPNPASGVVNMEIRAEEKGRLTFDLYNSTGQLAAKQTTNTISGQQFVTLPVEKLARGSYFLKISSENSEARKTIPITLQ